LYRFLIAVIKITAKCTLSIRSVISATFHTCFKADYFNDVCDVEKDKINK